MGPVGDERKYPNIVLVAFLIAVLLFASPFRMLWMSAGTPWYVAYLIWLAVIALTCVAQLWRGRHGL